MSIIECGYKLGVAGLQVLWANKPYKGYDRGYYFEKTFDYLIDDGSELWRLQREVLKGEPYFHSFEEVREFQIDFARNGKSLDIIKVGVREDVCEVPARLEHLVALSDTPVGQFDFMGFDVGWLLGNHSILFQPGFMDDLDSSLQQYWTERVNQNGLFSDCRDAVEFRDVFSQKMERLPGEMDILAVQLLKLEKDASTAC